MIAASVVLCTPVVVGVPPAAAPDTVGGYASTHVLLRTRPGVTPVEMAPAAGPRLTLAAAGTPMPQREAAIAAVLERWRVSAIEPMFESGFANQPLAAQLGLDRYYRVETPPGTDSPGLVANLSRFGGVVEHVELDAIGGVAATPDDPDFDLQWGLLNSATPGADVNITTAWDITTGDAGLVLAVLDAGMDQHAELLARMIPDKNVAAFPDNDDTSDVCISHGTHVAGIAGAIADNTQGIAGVDWQCRIMPVRVLNSCSGPESYVAEGIIWATNNGADVINMSLQYSSGTAALQSAVQYAHAQGVVMIAASGNFGSSPIKFPALWPETIAVGAINSNDVRWSSSSYGPNLDVMAPGVTIWSLKDTTAYQYLTGTSMAAPHVSGIVTLMKSLDPALTPDGIKLMLQQTAADLGADGFDNLTGYGRVDATAALSMLVPVPGDVDGDGLVGIDDFLFLLGNWGPCPAEPESCPADFDGDEEVGINDFLILIGNWTL